MGQNLSFRFFRKFFLDCLAEHYLLEVTVTWGSGEYASEPKSEKKLSRSLELTQIVLGQPSVKVISPPTSGKLILSKDQLPSVVRRQVV